MPKVKSGDKLSEQELQICKKIKQTLLESKLAKSTKLSDDELIEELNLKKLNRRNKKNRSKYFRERCITPNTKTKFFTSLFFS